MAWNFHHKKGPLARLAYELGESEFDYSKWNICHGGKGSGGGTNTVETSSQPPQQVLDAYTTALNAAQSASSQPLQQYNAPTIAGFTPDQLSAFGTVNSAQGSAQPFIQQAQSLINQGTQPLWSGVQQFSPSAVQQYMSPYTNQVLNSQTALEQNQDQQQQAALQGNAISSGAWGGDRAGVASAVLSGQQDLANNSTNANILNTGYNSALGEFNTQQQAQLGANEANSYLNQQGAFGLANLGNENLNTQLTGANAQEASGALQQQLGQEALNVPYENFLQQQAYPFQSAQYYANIAEGVGGGSGGTSSTTSPAASSTSQLAGLGIGGLGIAGSILGNKRGGRIKSMYRGGRAFATGGNIGPDPNVPDLSISYIPTSGNTPGAHMGPPKPPAAAAPSSQQNSPSASNLASLYKSGSKIGNWISGLNLPDAGNAFSGAAGLTGAQDAANFLNPAGATSPFLAGAGDTSAMGSFLGDSGADAGLAYAGDAAGADLGASALDAAGLDAATAAGTDAAVADLTPLLFALKRGGAVKHYDDGGQVGGASPISAQNASQQMPTQSSNLNSMTPEQLQQLIMRLPAGSQQAQSATAILQQKRMMPNVGTAAQGGFGSQQQNVPMYGGYAKGGRLHYDEGGSLPPPPDADTLDRQLEVQNDVGQDSIGALASQIPASALVDPTDTGMTGVPVAPIGAMGSKRMIASAAPPASTISASSDEPPAPTREKVNPWLALAAAGFGAAAGTSPQASENFGRGALEGIKNYTDQTREADTVNGAADKLMQEAKQHKDAIAIEQENADTNKQNADTTKQYKDVLLNQGHVKVIPDGMGGFLQYDERNPNSAKTIQGAGVAASGDPALAGLTGQAYLTAFTQKDPVMAAQVKAMDQGDLNFPTGVAAKAPYWQQRLNALYRYNPDASQQTAAAYKQFMSGPLGNTTRSLNVATNHIDLANQLIDAMNNGNTKQINAIGNKFQTEFGLSSAPTNLDAVKQVMAGEIVKASTGAGGALGDRETINKTIDDANSPELLKGALKTYQGLMGGQFKGLKQQFESQTHRKDFDRFLEPEALAAMGAASPASTASPSDVDIDFLKNNPALAAKFEARFGAGSSKQYLGQ